MIQKQLPSCTESLYQIYSNQQIVEEVLKIKHHTHLINIRYERTFEQFFGNFAQPIGKYQKWAFDVLTFSESIQMLKTTYKMGQLMAIYRQVILNRLKKDRIAPILRNNQRQNQVINQIQRRYRKGIVQQTDSNTMHTSSSQKKEICQVTQIQKIIPSNIKINKKQSCQYAQDHSNQMFNKITQDLSRMIRNSCAFEQKPKNFNIKIHKFQTNLDNSKQFKRRLMEQNISVIQSKNQNYKYLNFDDPQQNYGLKKHKRLQNKIKQSRNKSRIKSFKSNQSKKSFRQINQRKKTQYQKLALSPLTPKPVSVSKSKYGWGDSHNKCSTFSLTSRVISNKKIGKQKKSNKQQPQQIKIKKPIPKSPVKIIYKPK